MTKTKTILAISLAAVFALSMVALPLAEAAGHLVLVKSKIDMNSDAIKKAEIKTAGTIPKINTAPSFFGYFLVTDGVFVAATTHDGFHDSETQDPDAPDGIWHTHMVKATDVTGCPGGLAVDKISFEENGKVKVSKDKIKFSDISRDALDLTNALDGMDEEFELGQPNGVVASFKITTVGADETFEVCLDMISPLEPTKFKS